MHQGGEQAQQEQLDQSQSQLSRTKPGVFPGPVNLFVLAQGLVIGEGFILGSEFMPVRAG